jgi:hypothetical protein
MRSRGQLEIPTLGSSSWMPCAPQGVKGTDDDEKLLIITALERYTVKDLMVTIYDFKANIIGNVDGSEIASQQCHTNRNYTLTCWYVTMLQLVVT